MQVYATCYVYCANKLVRTVLTDLQTRLCWKLIYMYVIRWCMSEIIDLTKKIVLVIAIEGNLQFFVNIFVRTVLTAWSTTYIMSIIVSNWQHCDKQQFRSLSCVHYTIFPVVKSDLFIRALLLDRILVTEKTSRTPRVHLVYIMVWLWPVLVDQEKSLLVWTD